MRLTDDAGAPPGSQDPRPPRPIRKKHVVRVLLAFLVVFGLGVFTWLSISYSGRQLTAQALELSGKWPQALEAPDKIIAHRLAADGDPAGPEVIPGVRSSEQREFKPGTEQARALGALFDEGKLTPDAKQATGCPFEGDFALEFVRGVSRRAVVFDLACAETSGDSGIHRFDAMAVAAFAATLFPADERYRKAAAGEHIR
jgi:hypothetical protein